MKKYVSFFAIVIFFALLIAGCSGMVNKPAQSAKQGEAGARFDTYSKLAGLEDGLSIIEVHNKLERAVVLKIAIYEDEGAWKLLEIPAQGILEIEVGMMDYLLQIQPKDGLSNQLFLAAGDATVYISGDLFDQYQIFFPEE